MVLCGAVVASFHLRPGWHPAEKHLPFSRATALVSQFFLPLPQYGSHSQRVRLAGRNSPIILVPACQLLEDFVPLPALDLAPDRPQVAETGGSCLYFLEEQPRVQLCGHF